MIGAFPPVIKNDNKIHPRVALWEEADEVCSLTILNKLLEARISELEAQLETLSPGILRG